MINGSDWVNSVECFEVKGEVSVGRARKTLNEILRKDLECKGFAGQVTLYHVAATTIIVDN